MYYFYKKWLHERSVPLFERKLAALLELHRKVQTVLPGAKLVSAQLSSPKISDGPTSVRSRGSAVRNKQRTA
jgi:hypothetical protein